MAIGAERRLAKVEAALGPTELVLRWLAEAHAYDDFEAYVRVLYAEGPDALPLDRLIREAQGNTRGRSRDAGEAVRRSVRRTLFLFHLVLRTIVLAKEALDRETLLYAVFSAHLALATVDTDDGRRSAVPCHAARLATNRSAVMARVSELRALETARAQVEAEFFNGQTVLFPATLSCWTEQVDSSERLGFLALQMAELEALDPFDDDDPDVFATRVDQLVADHVEPARMKALDEMGEGRRAASIAIRWLRPTLMPDEAS